MDRSLQSLFKKDKPPAFQVSLELEQKAHTIIMDRPSFKREQCPGQHSSSFVSSESAPCKDISHPCE